MVRVSVMCEWENDVQACTPVRKVCFSSVIVSKFMKSERPLLPKTSSFGEYEKNKKLDGREGFQIDGGAYSWAQFTFVARRYATIFFALYQLQILCSLIVLLFVGIFLGPLAAFIASASLFVSKFNRDIILILILIWFIIFGWQLKILLVEFRRGDHVSIDQGLLRQVGPVLLACGKNLLLISLWFLCINFFGAYSSHYILRIAAFTCRFSARNRLQSEVVPKRALADQSGACAVGIEMQFRNDPRE